MKIKSFYKLVPKWRICSETNDMLPGNDNDASSAQEELEVGRIRLKMYLCFNYIYQCFFVPSRMLEFI